MFILKKIRKGSGNKNLLDEQYTSLTGFDVSIKENPSYSFGGGDKAIYILDCNGFEYFINDDEEAYLLNQDGKTIRVIHRP